MRPADGGSIHERRRIQDELGVHADFVASPVGRAARNRPKLLDRTEAGLEIRKEREQVAAETAKRTVEEILGCIRASPKRVFPLPLVKISSGGISAMSVSTITFGSASSTTRWG
jgi:hypothetical protein